MLVQNVQLFKNGQKSPSWQDRLFVHLDLVSMSFTYSYIGGVHLSKLDFFVHLFKMDFVVEMHPIFVTSMLFAY
jgi:hypothetical protein